MNADHKLTDNTLTVEADGIHARCTCGWDSGPKFSSMLASVAFSDHRDEHCTEDAS